MFWLFQKTTQLLKVYSPVIFTDVPPIMSIETGCTLSCIIIWLDATWGKTCGISCDKPSVVLVTLDGIKWICWTELGTVILLSACWILVSWVVTIGVMATVSCTEVTAVCGPGMETGSVVRGLLTRPNCEDPVGRKN